jgi:hypothetical protein
VSSVGTDQSSPTLCLYPPTNIEWPDPFILIEELMSALCNLDYQVNYPKLMTALDDFIKVGVGGRRRKRKLELIYGNEEATFDFQGDVLNITHNGMTKRVEAKGKGIGRVFINWKCLAYFSTYEKNQEYLRVFVEDNLFHIETLSFPCTKTEIYSAVNDDRNYDRNDDRDVDFYKEFGGDGDRDAYLGDGISIRPDGTYYDDR